MAHRPKRVSIPERQWTAIPGLGVEVLQFNNTDADAWRDPAGGDGWTIDIHYGPLHVRPISGESDPPGGGAR